MSMIYAMPSSVSLCVALQCAGRACGVFLTFLLFVLPMSRSQAAVVADPTNEQLAQHFLLLAYGEPKDRSGRGLNKFLRPIRVAVIGDNPELMVPLVSAHVEELGWATGHSMEIVRQGIAEIIVILTRHVVDDALGKHRSIVRSVFATDKAMIETIEGFRMGTQGFFSAGRGDGGDLIRAVVVLPSNVSQRALQPLLVNQLSRSLGLVYPGPPSLFSTLTQETRYSALTPEDRLLLKVLYDQRLRPGMSEVEAGPKVRRILSELRPGK